MLYLSKNKISYFSKYLVLFLVLEFISILAWYFDQINLVILALVFLATIYLFYKNRQYALYIPLAEIFWGSLGHSFDYAFFSLRMTIFLAIILSFTLAYFSKVKYLKIWQDKSVAYIFMAILFSVILSILMAWKNSHSWQNIFFDVNAYFYVLYLPIWYQVFDKKMLKNILAILKAAVLVTAVKTLVLLNIFSQNYSFLNTDIIYKWVRDSRTGEITPFQNDFFRIYMQSQFYLLLAFFYLLYKNLKIFDKKYILFLALISAAILVSLSRSFWLGIFVALLFIFVNILIYRRQYISWLNFLKFVLVLILTFVSVEIFYNIPNYKNLNIWGQRTIDSNEPAASSRAQLWGPMWENISKQPIFGYGFGKELSYQSSDPRIKNENNPQGWHTTYAFEWGWMDQLLKGGLLNMAVFLSWFAVLYRRAYTYLKDNMRLYLPLLGALSALFIIHIFTPYINHPLGLALLMLATTIFNNYGKSSFSHN